MEQWLQLLKVLMTNHSLIHKGKAGSDALCSSTWILWDSWAAVFVTHSCHHPCMDQLIRLHCLISKKMTQVLNPFFFPCSSAEFLLKNVFLRMTYPHKKGDDFSSKIKLFLFHIDVYNLTAVVMTTNFAFLESFTMN